MLATQSIRFSNEYIEFWKLNPNFPQTNQKCNRKIAPTTDHQKRPKLSRKRKPKKKDFVVKRKAPSQKARCYKLFKMFFPLTMTGFFDTRKGEILMSMILGLKSPKKILTLFSKWCIIIMRQFYFLKGDYKLLQLNIAWNGYSKETLCLSVGSSALIHS